MYMMYVDESGDIGLVNSPTPYFVLCGLVVHELRWRQYLDELIDFRRQIKANFGLKLREEIHASVLINKPGILARIPKHQRLEILRKVADTISNMPDFSLISVVVDKTKKRAGYDVFEKACQALIQRFENTIANHNFAGPKNADDKGMLFPDRTDDKKLMQLLRKMRNFNPIPNQVHLGAGYRNLTLRAVIEDANFRDSEHSYFIQMVDVIAYLLFQSLRPSSYMKSESAQNYFSRLTPICCKVASPHDPLGIVRL
jgi:Protein of unknown function (DUF3800)